MTLTIVIADDYELMRRGILSVIEDERDMEVVGACATGDELLELVSSCCPGVVIVDVAIGSLDIFDLTKRIKTLSPTTRVVVLSGVADETYLRRLLDSGVAGYVLRTGTAFDLIEAVRGNGSNVYISPAATIRPSQAQSRIDSDNNISTHASWLSPRQSEVLRLISEGHTSKEIAVMLGIGESTVKSHRKNIMEKLEIHDRVALTRYALRIGLIRPQ